MEMLTLFLLNMGMTVEDLDLSQELLEETGADRRLALVLERARERDLLPKEMGLGQLRRYFQILKANARANADHKPRACDRRLTLLRALEPIPDFEEQGIGVFRALVRRWHHLLRWFRIRWNLLSRNRLGWEKIEGARVDLFRAPGHHFSMLAEEHIAAVARILREQLTLAEEELESRKTSDPSTDRFKKEES
jgi:thioesterase domain-containing protein